MVPSGDVGVVVDLPKGANPGLGLVYYLNHKTAITGTVGVGFDFSKNAYNVSLEIGYRSIFAAVGRALAFVEPAAFIGNPGGNLSFALEGSVGVMVFATPHFAFGASTGLALQVKGQSASSGSGGSTSTDIELTTGTSALFGELLW